MNLISRLSNWFGSSDSVDFARGVETAITETSALYISGDIPKYNPDDLIGRKGAGIYDLMRHDEQIKAGLKFKRDAIVSRGYYFKLSAEKSGLSDDEVARRIAISEGLMQDLSGSFTDALHKILTAMRNGFSITEKIFNQVEIEGLTYIGLRHLKLKPSNTFRFRVDEYGNVEQLEQQVGGRVLELDYNKFIHFVINPDVDEHYGESELRACYRAWFSKDVAIKLRNIYLERHAGGFHIIKPPSSTKLSAGTTEYTALVNLLKNINLTTGVILPSSEYDMEAKYPSGKGGDAFDKTIDMSDMQIARALLVPSLMGVSPQGDTGSFAQSQTQLDAFFWTLANDADRLAECLNEQVFRPLADHNFGDGIYPRFAWNPLSQTKAVEIIKVFSDLVDNRILTSTEEDEEFIRDTLDLPSVKRMVEDETDDGEGKRIAGGPDAVQGTALNGMQVAALKDMLLSASNGELPLETVKIAIAAAFPLLTPDQIDSMVEPIIVEEPEEGNDQGDSNQEGDQGDGLPPEELDDQDDKLPTKEEPEDETIAGQLLVVTNKAFKKAQSRVSFAKIDKDSEVLTETHVSSITNVTDLIVEDLIAKAKEGGELTQDVADNFRKVKVEPKLKAKLNSKVSIVLKDGERLGRKEAAKEIDTAMKEAFSLRANYARMDFIADDYFKTSAFNITGNLTDAMTKVIQLEILNGAKFGKSWDDVTLAIYSGLMSDGLVSEEAAKAELGEALLTPNPAHRIQTIVRTSTFDAINNARDSYFTDPQLGDFVKAYEYSAILDSRVTEICRHLDDDDAGDHSLEWYSENAGFKPPNHFNCRSILIAVTVNDLTEFEEGPQPKIEPQEGFK